jgi:5'-methylthioadenosine phosphorylase
MGVVNIALITDYDSGVHADAEAVTAHSVLEVFQSNSEKIKRVVLDLIGKIPTDLSLVRTQEGLQWTRGDGHATSPDDLRIFQSWE